MGCGEAQGQRGEVDRAGSKEKGSSWDGCIADMAWILLCTLVSRNSIPVAGMLHESEVEDKS